MSFFVIAYEKFFALESQSPGDTGGTKLPHCFQADRESKTKHKTLLRFILVTFEELSKPCEVQVFKLRKEEKKGSPFNTAIALLVFET